MHIVYLIENIDTVGGIQNGLSIRVNELVKKYNHKITIVCTNHNTKVPAYNFDQSIEIIFLEKLISRSSLIGRLILQWKQSKMIIKSLKPDVVITVKYTMHNVFFKFLNSNVKFVSELRETKENYDQHKSKAIKSRFYICLRDFILKRQDLLIVLTEADKRKWGFNNIKVIKNTKTFESDTVSSLNNKVALAVGRLEKVKRFDLLIEIWQSVVKKAPDWQLKICGKGSEYKYLDSLINKYKLRKSVIITNHFVDVKKELLNSSLLLMTSKFESFGNVLVEAKICGVPAIAFDVPNGPSEIIENEEDGYLINDGNTEEMLKRVLQLINNESKRKQMGKHSKLNEEKFDVVTIIKNYNEILLNLFSTK